MIEKFLIISYFDMIIGPNILFSKSDISNIYGFPEISKILEFSETEGAFIFSFRKFQTINRIFYMESNIARGGKDLIMISCVIRASYFKNELTDIFKYLEFKKPILEEFVVELKKLPNFNIILHKYKKDPSKKQFTEYCEEHNVNFFSIYNKYYDLIFPESEIRIITQDLNLKKKILLLGKKDSGKDTFLRTIETLQFYNQKNLDIPTRILSVIIDNIILLNPSELSEENEMNNAQAVIYIFRNTIKEVRDEVNIIIENIISSSTKMHNKVPLLIINNIIKDNPPLKEEQINKSFNLKKLKEHMIPFKYYTLNVINEDPILMEPLKWLVKKIFT